MNDRLSSLSQAQRFFQINNVGNGDDAIALNVPLPPDTQGVGFLCDFNVGQGLPQSVTIKGHATQAPYIRASPKSPTGDLTEVSAATETSGATEIFPVDASAVDLEVVGSAFANPSVVYFFAYTTLPRVRVSTAPDDPLLVTDGGAPPASWQAPNRQPAIIDFSLPGSSSVDIIPAVAGQTVRLHGLSIQLLEGTGVGGGRFQDTDGASLGAWVSTTVRGGPPFVWSGGGDPLTPGVGFRILNDSAVAVSCNGMLGYSRSDSLS
jgi:hypothetical protein